MKEGSLKRLIRAMNSCLNLYDVDDIPEEIVDILMRRGGVEPVADLLGLTKIAEVNDDGEIIRYLSPGNFEKWIEDESAGWL